MSDWICRTGCGTYVSDWIPGWMCQTGCQTGDVWLGYPAGWVSDLCVRLGARLDMSDWGCLVRGIRLAGCQTYVSD